MLTLTFNITPVVATDSLNDPLGTPNSSDPNLPGDHPPTTYFMWTGHGGLKISAIGSPAAPNPSGSFNISGIPAGSSIVKAVMYTTSFEQSPVSVSATLSGNALSAVTPFAHDAGTGYSYYDLCSWRWDVTAIVTGDGIYPFTTSGMAGQAFLSALVVVYSNPSEPLRQVIINDGAESLYAETGTETSTSTFSNVQAGTGTLIICTSADDSLGTSESISFNGIVILGPGDVFWGNLGYPAGLFHLSVSAVAGTNTVNVTTDIDWIGWHIAILISELPPPACMPVGGYSFPIQVQTKTEPIIPYIALIATLTAIFTKLRPKTKRKR